MKHIVVVLTIAFFFVLPAMAQEDLGPMKELFVVDDIKVLGTRKVEPEAILEKIAAKKEMKLDNYLLKKDIVRIYEMKYFDTVEAHHEVENGKNILVFKVKEKPIISKIILEGNDDVKNDDLKEQIKTKEFSILDVNTVKADVVALQKFYEEKGFYLANVDYEIRAKGEESVELVFKISEFEKVRVKSIRFLGNEKISDIEIKANMETREESLFSGLSGSGNFKEFNFNNDVERIKYYYKSKGYLQVNVGTPAITVSEDKHWVFITIKVTEGPQFSINEIFFEGDMLFTEEEFNAQIKLKKEEIYSEDNLRLDIQQLTEMYQDKGYAFANVLRTLDIVPGENKVDIHFSFEKGKIAYFGNITVKGNTKTRDKVVRRELKIREGQMYSGSGLRLSKESVNRLGFFEPNSVIFNTVSPKGKDDILDVEISVKERNTGQITLGAGYSTASRGFLQGSISQNNFRGLGQTLTASMSLSAVQKSYNLGFTEPYLMDSKWTAGGDVYRTQSQFSSSLYYDKIGTDARVGHPIAEYTRAYITYKLENTNISNVRNPTIDPHNENGVASSIQTSVVRDQRNNIFEPTGGSYQNISAQYTGLGGFHRSAKFEGEARWYKPIYGDLIFRTRGTASKLVKTTSYRQVPRTEKFVMGGARNMRGYNFEDIGPLVQLPDSTGRTSTFNQGGLFSLLGTAEIEHPLIKEAGLKWALFYDTGNVYKYNIGENGNWRLRSDYGFGFRWFSPIGVLRFEFAYPVKKLPRESGSQFLFDIGQIF
ncbi:MAG: outer membrane protein assembly factor BamA [Bacteriovoracaceae bacterium]